MLSVDTVIGVVLDVASCIFPPLKSSVMSTSIYLTAKLLN